ncbi:hypothetical protein [Paenibacillus pinisoli]|nr:hypothetical protein [Paenibacillus pinisoli]
MTFGRVVTEIPKNIGIERALGAPQRLEAEKLGLECALAAIRRL